MAETNGGSAPDIVEQYDLLPKMIPYLDRHLVYPLVADRADTLENKKLRFELLKTTNMVDYIAELDKEIRNLKEKPSEYEPKRKEVFAKIETYEEETETLRSLLE